MLPGHHHFVLLALKTFVVVEQDALTRTKSTVRIPCREFRLLNTTGLDYQQESLQMMRFANVMGQTYDGRNSLASDEVKIRYNLHAVDIEIIPPARPRGVPRAPPPFAFLGVRGGAGCDVDECGLAPSESHGNMICSRPQTSFSIFFCAFD